jgi:hypothetical protein
MHGVLAAILAALLPACGAVPRKHVARDYGAWGARVEAAVGEELRVAAPDLEWVHAQAARLHDAHQRVHAPGLAGAARAVFLIDAEAQAAASEWSRAGESRRWLAHALRYSSAATQRSEATEHFARAHHLFIEAERWDDAIHCGHAAALALAADGGADALARAAALQRRNAEIAPRSSAPGKATWFAEEASRLRAQAELPASKD